MSGSLYSTPFQPLVHSTAPGFTSTSDSTALLALESTALNRSWLYPNGRTIRIASIAGDDFHIALGSSTILAGSTNATLVLGGTVELFRVQPGQSYIAIKSSTDVAVNITLGTGQ